LQETDGAAESAGCEIIKVAASFLINLLQYG
jgi:hypothetical protein